jgi:hypothetical protein
MGKITKPDHSGCVFCAAGTYSDSATLCTACSGNTYSASGASVCITCPVGTTANGGHTACA